MRTIKTIDDQEVDVSDADLELLSYSEHCTYQNCALSTPPQSCDVVEEVRCPEDDKENLVIVTHINKKEYETKIPKKQFLDSLEKSLAEKFCVQPEEMQYVNDEFKKAFNNALMQAFIHDDLIFSGISLSGIGKVMSHTREGDVPVFMFNKLTFTGKATLMEGQIVGQLLPIASLNDPYITFTCEGKKLELESIKNVENSFTAIEPGYKVVIDIADGDEPTFATNEEFMVYAESQLAIAYPVEENTFKKMDFDIDLF